MAKINRKIIFTAQPINFWLALRILNLSSGFRAKIVPLFRGQTWSVDSYRETQQDATVYQNFYYSIFKLSSTCFGRHTSHHQEPKTAQAASGFAYVEGCRTCSCWTLLLDNVQQLHVRQPSTHEKPDAACAV